MSELQRPLARGLMGVVLVVAAGGLALAVAGTSVGEWRASWSTALVLAVVQGVTMAYPVIVTSRAMTTIHADSAAIVAASVALSWRVAAVTVVVGTVVATAVSERSPLVKVMNGATVCAAAVAALWTGSLVIPPDHQPSLGFLAGAFVAGAVYDGLTLGLVALDAALDGREMFGTVVRKGFAGIAPMWPFVYAFGIVVGGLALFSRLLLPFVFGPLGLLVLVTQGRRRLALSERRLDGLLAVADAGHSADTMEAVEAAMCEHARELLNAGVVRIESERPKPGSGYEAAVRLGTRTQPPRWLVAWPSGRKPRRITNAEQPILAGIASIGANVLDSAARRAELEREATTDPLTGLPHRRAFEQAVELALRHAARRGDTVAVLLLDLDGFKPVNDRFGHAAGDEVLVSVARRLTEQMRATDTVCRLGGDEFTVLLPYVHGEDEPHHVAERIIASVQRPIRLSTAENVDVSVSVSVGVGVGGSGATVHGLTNAADDAMYEAKQAGGSTWRQRPAGASWVGTTGRQRMGGR